MKLSQAMKIMGFMVKDKHMDPQVFDLFFQSGVYKKYAEAHMGPAQIDEVPPPAPPQTGEAKG
jgi:HD-GYP domain-containing protein (c-di-GMP phosphodiesterase class II)